MRVKKLRHKDLIAFDKANDDCTVRELEMAVDSAVNHEVGYSLQFWRDAALYNVDAAIEMLPFGNPQVENVWVGIKNRIQKDQV